jgi:hypothetical protein
VEFKCTKTETDMKGSGALAKDRGVPPQDN